MTKAFSVGGAVLLSLFSMSLSVSAQAASSAAASLVSIITSAGKDPEKTMDSSPKKMLIRAAVADAAANLAGETPTALLIDLQNLIREELKASGDAREYSDLELSQLIINEFGR